MDIPIKITDIDSSSKYNFKLDQDQFVSEMNERIRLANKEKKLNIPEITKKQIQTEEIKSLFRKLENNDQKFGKLPANEVLKLDLRNKIKFLNSGIFRPQDGTAEEEIDEMKEIFSKILLNKYTLVNAKLNNIYIDPNTSAAEDKDKLFINLHVEMEEEGIRIVSYKDKDGKEIEQITFE
jgi:hypothetical protein